MLDIYAASEKPIEGITGEAIAERISKSKLPVQYATFGDAVGLVTELAQDGDMILTLGAGSVSHLGPEILHTLQSRKQTAAVAQSAALTR